MKTPLNRYPEACFPELLAELSDYTGVPEDQIICGSGSDELIAMINQSFMNPGDTAVTHTRPLPCTISGQPLPMDSLWAYLIKTGTSLMWRNYLRRQGK